MHIKNGKLEGLKSDILRRNSQIVVFGTGVIGATVVPEILCQLSLEDRIRCYIDNDRIKWGSIVRVSSREIPIVGPEELMGIVGQVTILLAISRYAEVLDQLQNMNCTSNMSVYIVPMLCITNYCGKKDDYSGLIKSEKMIIPKRIHYMWLGGKEIPGVLLQCIESWRRFCPDYEIIRWDESNYDVHKNIFMAEAYDNGRYGFVPDYARLDILYNYGGIYLDTDVELLRSIDELLFQEAFCGVEKWQVLNFGACSGAIKGHQSLEPFLERWEKRKIIREDGSFDYISSGLIDTSIAINNGYKINGLCQNIKGMNIYRSEFFNPYDYMTGEMMITEYTYSIHHFNGGWLDKTAKQNAMETKNKYFDIKEKACWVE